MDTDTEGRCSMKTDTDRGDASMNQATPRAANRHEKLREGHGKDYLPEPRRRNRGEEMPAAPGCQCVVLAYRGPRKQSRRVINTYIKQVSNSPLSKKVESWLTGLLTM